MVRAQVNFRKASKTLINLKQVEINIRCPQYGFFKKKII